SGIEIVLEISELEALNDIDAHLREAERWRKEGYQFALDDFGAGFVSLSFISQLVPEYIKIDRSAILRADASEEFKQFLSDLVKALGNYTQKGIIAEGIETEQELAMVEEIGIHLIQGFLFGKPKKLDDLKIEQNQNIHS
ncbi:MAG: EAL domain-containing protein, partial [Nitrospirota bacterium]|nr:EAL domain-containing protein [Nitrospirota bacterium]